MGIITAMYDRVKIRLLDSSVTQEMEQYLTGCREIIDRKTGEMHISGTLNGIRATLRPPLLELDGSLCRALYLSNLYPMDRKSARGAVEALSDMLHVPLDGAIVTRLEFGRAFMMRAPPGRYLDLLGEMPRYEHFRSADGTLYFKGRGKRPIKEFIFYDKKKEAERKGLEIPQGLAYSNMLRYEMRLKSGFARLMKWDKVTASTLSDREFYGSLVQMYKRSYDKISKKSMKRTTEKGGFMTPREAVQQFCGRFIENGEIDGYLQELKEANALRSPKDFTRVKRQLQELANLGGNDESRTLIGELNDEVANACCYE